MTQEIKIGSTVKRTDFQENSGDITTHPGVYGTVRYISTPTDPDDHDLAWAVVYFTLGDNEWIRNSLIENLEVVNLRKPPTCPACDGTDLRWYVAKRRGGLSGFPGANGPLNISEVQVIGYLACEECSETVRTIEVEEIEEMMNKEI